MNLNLQALVKWLTSFEGLATIAGGYLGYRYYGSKLGNKWLAGGAGAAAGMGAVAALNRLQGGLSAQSQAALQQPQMAPEQSPYVDLDAGLTEPAMLPAQAQAAANAAAADQSAEEVSQEMDGSWGFQPAQGFNSDEIDQDNSQFMS